MEGNKVDDNMESAATYSRNGRTLVMVGRTGNGKSATGNSILMDKAFISQIRASGVTSSCKLHQSKDKMVNVIDTPGLFDFTAENTEHGKEIIKCVNMANGGIHAVLIVFSVRNRFSREEQAVVECLQDFFGDKITNYMIVVFTGGDDLDDGETLDDYLGQEDRPEPLKELLRLCEDRKILFNNKTKDKQVKSKQLKELLNLVEVVVDKNGGTPYTNDLFLEMQESKKLREELAEAKSKKEEEMLELERRSKANAEQLAKNSSIESKRLREELAQIKIEKEKEMLELQERLSKANAEQLAKLTRMVEDRLNQTIQNLENRLTVERQARLNSEGLAKENEKRAQAEIEKLIMDLQIAQAKKKEKENDSCTIL